MKNLLYTLCLWVTWISFAWAFQPYSSLNLPLTVKSAVPATSTTLPKTSSDQVKLDTSNSFHTTMENTTYQSPSIRERLSSSKEDVSQVVAQMLYEDLLIGRYVEDMCAQMYYRSKVAGFVHLYSGQEAISTGVIKALRKDDYVVSTYRDHVHATSKGVPIKEVLAELFGKEAGCSKGRGGSMHMFSKEYNMVGGFAYIGEQIPVALGTAFASSFRKNTPEINDVNANQVTVCFLGDGAVNIGQFYESLNLASLAKLPVIFVIENNNWAIGMASYRSTAVPELYKKAEAFGIPGYEVDGMDVLAVRSVARKAIDRARKGLGPTVIEALTYRFRGHSLADPDELRAPLEKKTWQERDPVLSFGNYMKSMGYANDALLKHTQKKIREIVKEAAAFAENCADPPLKELGDYIFSTHYTPQKEELSPEQLNAYAQALANELDEQALKKMGERNFHKPVELQTDPLIVIE